VVTKIALQSQWQDVISASAQLFHLLINSEAEGLLDNKLFSRSLLDLVRYTVIGPVRLVDDKVESDLIELLFEIATKIRLDPDILSAWFHPDRERSQARALQGETRRNQFPLFYVLVQYVHHDGPVGDFARTALLYLTETASKSKSLETWMIESDLAPQMASGLGALYSQLSRHFPPLEAAEKSLPILAFSDCSSIEGSPPKETRESFQQNMKEFLAYLAFWQDTITHCKSPEVADTLLDHFQVLFVQQLLYPSLLESSDVDGGSTAAVIAHLARILTALDDQVLAQRMLRYLLASTNQARDPQKQRPRPSVSRRKSLDHLAALAEAAHAPSPDLFNLHDLIIMGLKSKHANTVNVCLKLLSIILSKHHPSVLNGLFRTEGLDPGSLDRSSKSFNASLVKFFDMASAVSETDTMDDSYETTLLDVKTRLERHSCSIQTAQDGSALPTYPPTVATDCKLLESLLSVLERFFANDTLTNLLLTESIISLAACGNIGIYGWLLSLSRDQTCSATITSGLERLSEQVRQWRSRYSEWDMLLTKRRHELLEEGPVVVSDVVPVSLTSTKVSEAEHAIRTPVWTSQQNSRPTTPRGPPIGSPKFGSIDGALSTSPNTRLGLQRPMARSPMAGSPLRQTYMPSSPLEQYSPESVTEPTPDFEELLQTQIELNPEKPPAQSGQSLSLLTRRLQAERPISNDSSSLAIVDDGGSGAATPSMEEDDSGARTSVSLSHILTNAIILQEFMLEVAAVVQIRGTMFEEVDL
jgi:Retinoic acid induced 16-like protein/Family of unknown function (DUF5917)